MRTDPSVPLVKEMTLEAYGKTCSATYYFFQVCLPQSRLRLLFPSQAGTVSEKSPLYSHLRIFCSIKISAKNKSKRNILNCWYIHEATFLVIAYSDGVFAS